MVSVLHSRGSSPGLSPAGIIVLYFLARHFTLEVLLSTQVYTFKWVLENLIPGGNPAMKSSIQSDYSRSRNTPSHFMLLKPG